MSLHSTGPAPAPSRAPIGVTMAAVAMVTLLSAAPAGATGFIIPDNGTKAVGRGGAYMLGATGPEVIYFNPALLTRLEGLQITLDVNLHDLQATFQREGTYPTHPDGDDVPFPAVENEFEGIPCCGVFPAPMLFVSHDFGLDDWGFGAAVYGPSAVGARKFPLDTGGEGLSPARYMLIEAEIIEIYYTLAAAWRWQGLRLGLSLQVAQLLPKFTIVTNTTLGDPSAEAPSSNAVTSIETSGTSPTGIIGVAYDVSPALSFGLTFQKGVDFESEGTVDIEFPADLQPYMPSLTDDTARFKVSDADILRFATRYAHLDGGRELFDVEFVATWERWSRNEAFEIEVEGDVSLSILPEPIALEPIVQQKNWKDAWSFRLGGDVPVQEWLTLRTGGFYETSAIPEAHTHLDFFSFDRFGAGLGATFHVGDFDIDLAYLHIFEAERTVEEGAVPAEAPIGSGEPPIVNEGTYTVSYDTFSLGVTYRFGAGDNVASRPAVEDL